MSVNIKAAFTKENREYNGLNSIEKALVDDPGAQRVVVALIHSPRTNVDNDEGVKTPVVQFDHIEPLFGEDAEVGRRLLQAAYKQRTDGATLFDVEQGDGPPPDVQTYEDDDTPEHADAAAADGGWGDAQ